MINKYLPLLLLYCLAFFAQELPAQTFGPIEERFKTIRQNAASSLEAEPDMLWIAPGLNAYDETTGEITIPEEAGSLFNGRGRVFSLAADNNRILAGLGFTSTTGGDATSAARGYYQSYNNGRTWNFLPFPKDERPPDEVECDAASVGPPCDLEFRYGNETYIRTRITVPEQSPPYEVDFYKDVLLSANWASGILRSSDAGKTWERLILPPSSEHKLTPGQTYQWNSQLPGGETVNRYDPRFDNNLLAFSVLIDDNQRVWVGTADGINLSENALSAPSGEIEWQHIPFQPGTKNGLLAGWIIKIRQQPDTNRIWMTNWRTDPENRDRFGLVYTDDLGDNFHHFLEGIRVNDVGFFDGTIFAASDSGLFLSKNDGKSWTRIEQITSLNRFIRPDTRYLALASTRHHLWVGTGDGIAATKDAGNTWKILRVDLPLSGGNIYQPDAPSVETYAYPNPFSPVRHAVVRIVYNLDRSGSATIRIFDFGMNPVRTLAVESAGIPGTYESLWDGTDDAGRPISGGTYFYSIETESGYTHGKILLLD